MDYVDAVKVDKGERLLSSCSKMLTNFEGKKKCFLKMGIWFLFNHYHLSKLKHEEIVMLRKKLQLLIWEHGYFPLPFLMYFGLVETYAVLVS